MTATDLAVLVLVLSLPLLRRGPLVWAVLTIVHFAWWWLWLGDPLLLPVYLWWVRQ